MKTVLVAIYTLVLAVHSFGDNIPENDESYHKCLKEKDINQEDVEKLQERDDPRLRCVMACVLEKRKLLKNGKIDGSLLKRDVLSYATGIGEQNVSKILDSCMNLAEDLADICDRSNVIVVCIEDELEKLGKQFSKD